MTEAEVTAIDSGLNCHDLKSILYGEDRDFLVRNNGDQVKISDLEGKGIGLYFSASWCGPCHLFTPKLVETYNELSSKNSDFEVVFVSGDEDEESFNNYFSGMPWLAIPFSDSATRDRLKVLFTVKGGIPHLTVLDKNGNVINDEGVKAVIEYGSEAFPFTQESIEKLIADAEAAKKNQTIRSVLVSSSRDFLISSSGKKVPVSELEGKIVGLYFSLSSDRSCRKFTAKLDEIYKQLKERGENFEVVLVSLDDDESSFQQAFAGMPWLAIPFGDRSCERLVRYFELETIPTLTSYFELETIPTLVVIGVDGKTLISNAAELVEDHGVEAYPFSPERLDELAEKERARMESQTLESLLVSGERDYVIGKDGIKVAVSELVGKNILLYFSAHWCPPCRAFLPKLTETYNKIKAKDPAFELIFISSDRDQASFDDYFASMPWLAIPFGDERKDSLTRTFKINGIPSLVAIGPTGRTVTKDARDMIMMHGAKAYPFTEEHIKELEAAVEAAAKQWPEKLKHALHEEHELIRIQRRAYNCDGCGDPGSGWSFYCKECDFDLHPKCALHKDEENDDEVMTEKAGYACDGEVCYKV